MTILAPIIATNVPAQVSGVSIPYRNLTMFGYKSFGANGIPVNNTATVYVGFSSGQLPMQITAGNSAVYTIQTLAERENLENLWFAGTNGDSLYLVIN